jgi:glycosyltransferase involved in cell wall biosynthesis
MRVLLAHNFYRHPGGEDHVFRAEVEVLRRRGHEVATFERSSSDAAETTMGTLQMAAGIPWSARGKRDFAAAISAFQPDLVHFHNFFPVVSPSAYYACREAHVPIVQTLHNYRLICARADLFRNGRVCEQCVGRKFAWPAIRHGCYHSSSGASAAVAGMLALHHLVGTWDKMVDRYVALTEFAKGKFEQAGFPADRIDIKPNFLVDPPEPRQGVGEYALFLGRLTEQKGVRVLMKAWDQLEIPLHIAGSGPLSAEVASWARDRSSVTVHDWQDEKGVYQLLCNARFLVFPSLWYEGLPVTILEAMAVGLPVLASEIGSLTEIVSSQSGGTRFQPDDAAGLAEQAQVLWYDAAGNQSLGDTAKSWFEQHYNEECGYRDLVELYQSVLAGR